jgi:hypothetical protein
MSGRGKIRNRTIKNFLKKTVCILAVALCMANITYGIVESSTIVAQAGGFVDKNSGIYKTGNDTQKTENATTKEAKWLEKQFITLLRGPGDILLGLEESWGMTMDNIVYGRIAHSGTNYYGFELVKGNPYGIVGAYIYNMFRLICWVMIWCIFMGQLVKGLIFGNSAKTREEAKSSLDKFIMISLFLYLMPYVVDLMIYIRDVFLYLINLMASTVSMTGSNGTTVSLEKGIADIFSGMADNSWIWAVVFSASTVLALYFSYVYVGVALGMTIYFCLFPMVCVMSYTDKNLLNNWFKNVLSALLVPVIDSILLLLPVTVYNVVYGQGVHILAGLLTLMICMMLIPTRRTVGQILGLNMGGIGAMAGAAMGALALARSAGAMGKAIKEGREHRANARAANEEADMLEKMGAADEAAQNGFGRVNGSQGLEALENGAEGGFESGENAEGFSGGSGMPALDNVENGQSAGNDGAMAGAGMGDMEDLPGTAGDVSAGLAAMQNTNSKMGPDFRGQASMMNMPISAKQNQDRAAIEQETAAVNAARQRLNSGEVFDDETRSQLENTVSSGEANIAAARSRISQGTAAMDSNNMRGAVSQAQLAQARQRIIDSSANVNNLNSAAFSGMSNQRRAQLLRQYAKRENTKAFTSTAGAVFGAAYGASAGLFFGPTAMTAMAAGGSLMGSHVGTAAGGVIDSAANTQVGQATGRLASAGFNATKATVKEAVSMSSYGPAAQTMVQTGRNAVNGAKSSYSRMNAGMNGKAEQLNDYTTRTNERMRDNGFVW